MSTTNGSMWKEALLREVVPQCTSLGQVLDKIGSSKHGSHWTILKEKLALYEIDYSHFKKKPTKGSILLSPEEVFILVTDTDGKNRRSSTLKRYMLLDSRFEYRCSTPECPIVDTWLGKPVVLQVDHINGNPWDNRVENLRFLCPTCHSQTPTFARGHKSRQKKNISVKYCSEPSCTARISYRAYMCRAHASKYSLTGKSKFGKPKIDWPQIDELLDMLAKAPYTTVARELGVSDNAIRKHLKNKGIEPPGNWYKRKNK